jgi:hypothetical protein
MEGPNEANLPYSPFRGDSIVSLTDHSFEGPLVDCTVSGATVVTFGSTPDFVYLSDAEFYGS